MKIKIISGYPLVCKHCGTSLESEFVELPCQNCKADSIGRFKERDSDPELGTIKFVTIRDESELIEHVQKNANTDWNQVLKIKK